MLLRLLTCVLLSFAGCAKQADLPAIVVSAESKEEFTRFRADLGARFPEERLKDFDTAVRELQLDAMHREIATAAARETDMLHAVHGKSVLVVTVLGWAARQARFLREIAEITRMLDHDLKQPQTEAVLRRLGSEKEVLAQLQANLAETERKLAGLQSDAPPSR